jgi:hypothetical protein
MRSSKRSQVKPTKAMKAADSTMASTPAGSSSRSGPHTPSTTSWRGWRIATRRASSSALSRGPFMASNIAPSTSA